MSGNLHYFYDSGRKLISMIIRHWKPPKMRQEVQRGFSLQQWKSVLSHWILEPRIDQLETAAPVSSGLFYIRNFTQVFKMMHCTLQRVTKRLTNYNSNTLIAHLCLREFEDNQELCWNFRFSWEARLNHHYRCHKRDPCQSGIGPIPLASNEEVISLEANMIH